MKKTVSKVLSVAFIAGLIATATIPSSVTAKPWCYVKKTDTLNREK